MTATTTAPPATCASLARLDELVFQVGVDMAFPGRVPLLGQGEGAHPFAVDGSSVRCTLPRDPRGALADAVARTGASRRVVRRLRRGRDLPAGVVVDVLVDLAHERLALAAELHRAWRWDDARAARCAGEELVVAALEVSRAADLARAAA